MKEIEMRLTARLLIVVFLVGTIAPRVGFAQVRQSPTASDAERIARLETQLESLRQELRIPGFSAAIVRDQKIIWAKGFGFADVEKKIPATEHTPYHLASLTKTFASTIVMQLVQEGKVKLDDPVSKYGINLESEGVIRVRHLLSHTSEGNPGEHYRYNGNRYGQLDKVIEKATGKSFAELLIANILDPLSMDETAPNVPSVVETRSPAGTDPAAEAEVKTAVTNLIAGYNSGNIEQIERYIAPEQTSFHGEGGLLGPFVNTADLGSGFKAGLKLNFTIYDLAAAVYGDTAVTTFIMTGKVSPPNGTPRNDGPWRSSYVWNKQNGSWRLVHAHQSALTASIVTEQQQRRFDTVSKSIAQGYALDSKFAPVRTAYPTHFSTAAGLITSVLDMAKYDIAIDQNKFLNRETQQLAFIPTVSTKGETLPYGLGWFTQDYKGTKLLWHYGYWTANSSFILKVPDQHITFIIAANTDNLSRPTDLGAGDALSSPVGMAFLKTFIFPEKFATTLPEINWGAPSSELGAQLKQVSGKAYADLYNRDLISKLRIYQSVGQTADTTRFLKTYSDLYSKRFPADLAKLHVIAQIVQVLDNEDKTVAFSLPGSTQVRLFAIGEGQAGEMFDYGWIENTDKGFPVWVMQEPKTTHAGGANKNRQVDQVITLPAGNYKLRYKTDDSHAFDHWNSLPPDINFWGIAIYKK